MRLPPLEELLPLGPPMLWLDQALHYDGSIPALTCGLTLREDHPFAEAGALPALCALEWMTQTAHALAALSARARGEQTGPQRLARVAQADFQLARFNVGDVLSIEARAQADGSFACTVSRAGRALCTAELALAERAKP